MEAAIEILKKGGSAVDAAIAAHSVLGLVEPQSSGLGGGGFMLTYDYKSEEMSFMDGREVAPAKATVDMFMNGDTVMPFIEAWQSGKAVGVPGIVALYTTAHNKYGKLPWPSLFEYAIKLADDGFIADSSDEIHGIFDDSYFNAETYPESLTTTILVSSTAMPSLTVRPTDNCHMTSPIDRSIADN